LSLLPGARKPMRLPDGFRNRHVCRSSNSSWIGALRWCRGRALLLLNGRKHMDPALCHRNRAGKGRGPCVAARNARSILPMNVDHVASERIVVQIGRQFSVSLLGLWQ
jgi:hypothetical protein